jgi:hypothetical protein
MLPITFKEDEGPYDGVLSTYKEWHAGILGVGVGIAIVLATLVGQSAVMAIAALAVRLAVYALTGRRAAIGDRPVDLPEALMGQLRDEPHYYFGGLVAGAVGTGVTVLFV